MLTANLTISSVSEESSTKRTWLFGTRKRVSATTLEDPLRRRQVAREVLVKDDDVVQPRQAISFQARRYARHRSTKISAGNIEAKQKRIVEGTSTVAVPYLAPEREKAMEHNRSKDIHKTRQITDYHLAGACIEVEGGIRRIAR
ncbi:hypothetical protein RB195_018579 [Necator americanus]|uniref:Uncharacterized protein n=1 Tax=Necator americanus TaxID=51031 RepID=A0ABR1CC13_NECAM